jgi:hypothetical protein
MPKAIRPITTFTRDEQEAIKLAAQFPQDSRALTSGAGTLAFHRLIAEHGAGEFTNLYVPRTLRGTFKTPAGGTVLQTYED